MVEALNPRDALQQAAQQFDAHQFWECHETLEAIWHKTEGLDKLFFQGIIQVAAGFHHIQHGNQKGACSLLRQGLDKLNHVINASQDACWPMDLHGFIGGTQAVYQTILALPAEAFSQWHWADHLPSFIVL